MAKIFSYSIWLGWLNSAVNPLIYYSNIKIRHHVSKNIQVVKELSTQLRV